MVPAKFGCGCTPVPLIEILKVLKVHFALFKRLEAMGLPHQTGVCRWTLDVWFHMGRFCSVPPRQTSSDGL